jgi:hypothetical protein
MFMEDLISKLAKVDYVLASNDRKFVRSIARRVDKGTALTTRQGWAFLNVLKNNKEVNAQLGIKKDAFKALLATPQWRKPLVPSVELRSEVRHLGDNMLGFRSSSSRTEIEFAAMKAVYSNGMKIVTIENQASLDAVIEFIGKWGFEMDVPTERYLADCITHAMTPARVIVEGENILIDVPNQNALAQFAQHVLGADIL